MRALRICTHSFQHFIFESVVLTILVENDAKLLLLEVGCFQNLTLGTFESELKKSARL